MIKPQTPPGLRQCDECGKVIGPHKGWFGPECQCALPPQDALRGAHGAGPVRSGKPTPLPKLRITLFLAIKPLGIG